MPHSLTSRRRPAAPALALLLVVGAIFATAAPALGQDAADKKPKVVLLGEGPGDVAASAAPDGMACTVDEFKAYNLAVEARSFADAREAGEQILDRDSDSFVAHLVLGFAHHYGEGNLPRSAYHLKKAISVLRDVQGDPVPEPYAKWEAFALRELGKTQSQLGRFEEAIASYDEHDLRHPSEPKEKISTVWPLLQLRRFDDALYVAHSILRDPTTNPGDRAVALNGYVAVLFERGDRAEALKWALQLTTEFPDSPTFWANASEAARGLMQHDESERLALESTNRGISDFAQPWIDLADLYMREGRVADAYQALLRDRRYREGRPAYLEQQGAASAGRCIAALMLLYNDGEAASTITERAVIQPDRSGGKSRDIRQDVAASALMDWRANTDRAMTLSDHADILGGLRLFTRGPAWSLGAEAWTARTRAQAVLHDNELLIGMIRVGGPYGVALPPWLVGELAHIVGPGVFYNAVRRARDAETTEALSPYFDAFRADAEWATGDTSDARTWANKALDGLPDKELLLRLRMQAMLADGAMADGDLDKAIRLLEPVVASDPGVLRRLNITLPLVTPTDAKALAVHDALLATDRYDEARQGWTVTVTGESICLDGPSGTRTKCSTTPHTDLTDADWELARVIEFHDNVFRPDDPLNWLSLRGLDGNRSASAGNKGLRNLFDFGGGDGVEGEKTIEGK